MRRSANFLIPSAIITLYYVLCILGFALLVYSFPGLQAYLPVGGLDVLLGRESASFEIIETIRESESRFVLDPYGALRLAIASVGTAVLMIPISWVYIITNRASKILQSFVQTIVVLPIIVTGIAMIVQNSLALAFSLAGIVAAVRFRFTLAEPSHALYIFAAIAIGLGSGIGALGVALVISMMFVYANLVLWKLDYGRSYSGAFFSMLSRRDRREND